MVDPITSLGAAANIVQFTIYAAQIIARLNDFHSSTHTDPQVFRDIRARLPLMLISLHDIQTKSRKGHFNKKEREALEPLLADCRAKIEELDRILGRILPVPGKDGVWTRAGKALASVGKEKRVEAISLALDRHLQVLVVQQAARRRWPGWRRAGIIVGMTMVATVRREKGGGMG